MRLINTVTYRLGVFLEPTKTPQYAVLSYTWGDNEVLFNDIQRGHSSVNTKRGLRKVEGMCKKTLAHGYAHAIDSCRIGKLSNHELSEAVNSIFLRHTEPKEHL